MWLHRRIDGLGRGPQSLSDDMSSVEAAPGVLATRTDERVDTVRFEGEQFLNRHTIRLRAFQWTTMTGLWLR
jgi:hypothetical protein